MRSPDEVAALQRALATEHAASWACGLAGARLDDAARAQARAADDAHRARRDLLVGRLRGAGASPTPAAAAYSTPEPVTDPRAALRLLARVEEDTAAAYADLLGATSDPGLRRSALTALTDAATRAVRWRHLSDPAAPASRPFPGRA